jgi:hypothetical protein
VFVGVQVALVGASAVTHLLADPVYGDKERRLRRVESAAPPGAPRVLALGTARTGYGFEAGRAQRAAVTPAAVFNFGVPGAGPVTHLIYLRRLLAAGHRPDLLVLEILPPLLADLPGGPLEARALSGGQLSAPEIDLAGRYGVPTERLRAERRAAARLPVSEHRFKLLGRLFPSALPDGLRYNWGRTPDPNGWNAADVLEVTDAGRARGVAGAGAEYRDVLRLDLTRGPAVRALRDVLALCRAQGVPVVLVMYPEGATFRAMYPADAEPKLAALLAGLTAEFGCPVTDARAWLADDLFVDNHHLLRAGAAAFTDRLAGEVLHPWLCGHPTGGRP